MLIQVDIAATQHIIIMSETGWLVSYSCITWLLLGEETMDRNVLMYWLVKGSPMCWGGFYPSTWGTVVTHPASAGSSLKGALRRFGEEVLNQKLKKILIDSFFSALTKNKLSQFHHWINKLTAHFQTNLLCLHVADPATFLASNSDLLNRKVRQQFKRLRWCHSF